MANSGDNNLSIYRLDQASGALTSAGNAAAGNTAAGNTPSYVTVDPSGKFAYVANQGDGTVSIFTIDASTGALTSAGAAVSAGVTPSSIAITGVYPPPMAYVVNYRGNSLSEIALDPVTGAPTSVGEVSMGAMQGFEPNGWTQDLAVDPLGRFVFVPHFSTNEILVYAIDPITGALTSSASVPATLAESIAIDPSGRFLYAGNRLNNNGTISEYSIDPTTGALTFMGTVSAPLIEHMVVDPSGSFVYTLTGNGWYLTTYQIDPITGLLTFVSSVDSYYVKEIAIDPFGRFLYTTTASSGNPTINTYALDAVTGQPSLKGRCPTGTNAMQMWSPAVHPTGRFAYAIGYKWLSTTSSTMPIYVYSIDPGTGTLTITSETIVEEGVSGALRFALDPSGNFLYAVSNAQPCAVVAFAVDASTGALTTIGGTVSGVPPLSSIVLQNGAEDLTVAGSAPGTASNFTFTAEIPSGGSYSVSVQTHPSFLSCAPVTNGSGQNVQANVTDVAVTCASNTTGLGTACTAPGTQDPVCNSAYPWCHNFTQSGDVCTMACAADGDCPIGSNGVQKCNTEHRCRP